MFWLSICFNIRNITVFSFLPSKTPHSTDSDPYHQFILLWSSFCSFELINKSLQNCLPGPVAFSKFWFFYRLEQYFWMVIDLIYRWHSIIILIFLNGTSKLQFNSNFLHQFHHNCKNLIQILLILLLVSFS